VHESGRGQSVPTRLRAKLPTCDAFELRIDQRRELLQRAGLTCAGRDESLRDRLLMFDLRVTTHTGLASFGAFLRVPSTRGFT
jgi:hypothetical protein